MATGNWDEKTSQLYQGGITDLRIKHKKELAQVFMVF